MVNGGQTFEFQQSGGKKKEKAKKASGLRIEIELDPSGITGEKADVALCRIFLTAQDRFADLVPDYWKPCALAASTGKGRKRYAACSFPPEFAAIPGLVSNSNESPESERAGGGEAKIPDVQVVPLGKGVTPPYRLSGTDPDFSNEVRQGYQGVIVLLIVVGKTGQVQNIRIWRPFGYGLDQKAVETAANWRFKPAEKDGQPVANLLQ